MKNLNIPAMILWFITLTLLSVNVAASVSHSADAFLVIKSQEPDFAEIMDSCFKVSKLGDGHFQSYRKKIKMAPYFPTVYVGYDHQLKSAESLSVTDNISISSGIVTVGPEDNDYDYDTNTGKVFRVRAVWNLSDAVFNRDLFTLENARGNLRKSRELLRAEIFEVYQARYLFLGRYLEEKQRSATGAKAFYIKYLALTDRLDEWTGGRFTETFWREK